MFQISDKYINHPSMPKQYAKAKSVAKGGKQLKKRQTHHKVFDEFHEVKSCEKL
jgi:hypothetical protein